MLWGLLGALGAFYMKETWRWRTGDPGTGEENWGKAMKFLVMNCDFSDDFPNLSCRALGSTHPCI